MKSRIALLMVLTTVAVLLVSCSGGLNGDPADEFVGIYKVTVYAQVKWGGDEGSFVDHGTLYMIKVSPNKVKISGFFSTYGTIASGSWIVFDDVHTSDSEGYIDERYNVAKLKNNVLQFTSLGTGQLKYNGVLYPWKRLSEYTAVKQ